MYLQMYIQLFFVNTGWYFAVGLAYPRPHIETRNRNSGEDLSRVAHEGRTHLPYTATFCEGTGFLGGSATSTKISTFRNISILWIFPVSRPGWRTSRRSQADQLSV